MSLNFVIYYHFFLHHNIDFFLLFIYFFSASQNSWPFVSCILCPFWQKWRMHNYSKSHRKTEKSILEWAKYTCMRTHNTCRTFKMRVLPNMMSDWLYFASSKFCRCVCVLLTLLSLAEIRDSRQSTHSMVFCNNSSFINFYFIVSCSLYA